MRVMLACLLLLGAGCGACQDVRIISRGDTGRYQWDVNTYVPCAMRCCREERRQVCACSLECPCWTYHRQEAAR